MIYLLLRGERKCDVEAVVTVSWKTSACGKCCSVSARKPKLLRALQAILPPFSRLDSQRFLTQQFSCRFSTHWRKEPPSISDEPVWFLFSPWLLARSGTEERSQRGSPGWAVPAEWQTSSGLFCTTSTRGPLSLHAGFNPGGRVPSLLGRAGFSAMLFMIPLRKVTELAYGHVGSRRT